MERLIQIYYLFDKEELDRLKEQIKLLGYSYRKLSKETCLCPSYISDLFNGKNYFDDRKIEMFKRLGFVFPKEIM
jgi:hypothetical protein